MMILSCMLLIMGATVSGVMCRWERWDNHCQGYFSPDKCHKFGDGSWKAEYYFEYLTIPATAWEKSYGMSDRWCGNPFERMVLCYVEFYWPCDNCPNGENAGDCPTTRPTPAPTVKPTVMPTRSPTDSPTLPPFVEPVRSLPLQEGEVYYLVSDYSGWIVKRLDESFGLDLAPVTRPMTKPDVKGSDYRGNVKAEWRLEEIRESEGDVLELALLNVYRNWWMVKKDGKLKARTKKKGPVFWNYDPVERTLSCGDKTRCENQMLCVNDDGEKPTLALCDSANGLKSKWRFKTAAEMYPETEGYFYIASWLNQMVIGHEDADSGDSGIDAVTSVPVGSDRQLWRKDAYGRFINRMEWTLQLSPDVPCISPDESRPCSSVSVDPHPAESEAKHAEQLWMWEDGGYIQSRYQFDSGVQRVLEVKGGVEMDGYDQTIDAGERANDEDLDMLRNFNQRWRLIPEGVTKEWLEIVHDMKANELSEPNPILMLGLYNLIANDHLGEILGMSPEVLMMETDVLAREHLAGDISAQGHLTMSAAKFLATFLDQYTELLRKVGDYATTERGRREIETAIFATNKWENELADIRDVLGGSVMRIASAFNSINGDLNTLQRLVRFTDAVRSVLPDGWYSNDAFTGLPKLASHLTNGGGDALLELVDGHLGISIHLGSTFTWGDGSLATDLNKAFARLSEVYGAYDKAHGTAHMKMDTESFSDDVAIEAWHLRSSVRELYSLLSMYTSNHETMRRENEVDRLLPGGSEYAPVSFDDQSGIFDESWTEMKPVPYQGCVEMDEHGCLTPLTDLKYYESPVYGNLRAVNEIDSAIKYDATNKLSKSGTFSNEETLNSLVDPRYGSFLYGSFIEWVKEDLSD